MSESSFARCSDSPPARAASIPRSTHRRASSIRRACHAVSAANRIALDGPPGLLLLLEHAGGRFRLAQSRVHVARQALALRQEKPGVSFEGSLARPLLVLEEVESDLRDADRLLRAERVERLLRELQTAYSTVFSGTSACEKWWTSSG